MQQQKQQKPHVPHHVLPTLQKAEMDLYFQEHEVDPNPTNARQEPANHSLAAASLLELLAPTQLDTTPHNNMMEAFVRHMSSSTANAPALVGTPPASSAVIRNLPKVHVKPQPNDPAGQICPVCTDEFELAEVVVELPCGHHFHNTCVVAWLNRHCTCPVCRRELPTDDSEYEAGKRHRRRNEAAAHLRNAIFN